jgi:type II secretory pathway pseudopilin PulG
VRRRTGPTAFSLIETVLVVAVIAIAVPLSTRMMSDAAADRADGVNALRAGTLAEAVLEFVIADAQSGSPGLGAAGLADAAAYLDAPSTGLRARLDPVASMYTDLGFSYTLEIAPPVSSSGIASGDPARDRYRPVSVTVSWPSARGGSLSLSVSSFAGEVTP